MTAPSPAAPNSEDLDLISALQADMAAADFTIEGVAALLGEEAVDALEREQPVPGQLHIRRLLQEQEPAAAAVLTALWLLDVPVTSAQLNAALPRTGVDGAKALRLVEEVEHGLLPTADLRPYQTQTSEGTADLWVLSDLSAHQRQGPLPHDHVLGIGQASLTLAGATHRREVTSALDIGTGCGIQLLHLLDHCQKVVGTDVSQRALDFARFNVLLNAEALEVDPQNLEDRVELLYGSLLEPVAGREFDLIVSNPPFVITPRTTGASVTEAGEQIPESQRYVYRDGGREGDALMAELIAALPTALAPGGTAQMLGNWEIGTAGPTTGEVATEWRTRPEQWAEQAGLEAWIIQRDQQSPAEYAETWLRDASEERDIEDYRQRYADYLFDFHSRGVEAVGFGMLWFRRGVTSENPGVTKDHRTTPHPWRRFEELTGSIQQPVGPVIGTTVERADQVAGDPDTVLSQHLVPAGDVTEERFQRFGAEHPEVIIARQGAGLRRTRAISSAAAGFLAAADGDFAVGQLITAVCSLTDADEETLTQEVLDLYIEGYLIAEALL